jgi:hypothetical protein
MAEEENIACRTLESFFERYATAVRRWYGLPATPGQRIQRDGGRSGRDGTANLGPRRARKRTLAEERRSLERGRAELAQERKEIAADRRLLADERRALLVVLGQLSEPNLSTPQQDTQRREQTTEEVDYSAAAYRDEMRLRDERDKAGVRMAEREKRKRQEMLELLEGQISKAAEEHGWDPSEARRRKQKLLRELERDPFFGLRPSDLGSV